MNTQEQKIFLSYAHIDLGFAKKIYSDLKRYGLDIWFDSGITFTRAALGERNQKVDSRE